MKNLICALIVTVTFTFIFSGHNLALAETKSSTRLPEETADEMQILHLVSQVQTVDFGAVTARFFTTSSFAEPENHFYLVLVKNFDFNPEEDNSALYSLSPLLSPSAIVKKVVKRGSHLVITASEHQKTKTVVIKIYGLKARY